MTRDAGVAIVGAGPYGLAAAAHLGRLRPVVFGRPMQTWRTLMPADMELRAAWDEMTLSAPSGDGGLADWLDATGGARREPMAVADFVRYADWYRERFVPEVTGADAVSAVERSGRFEVEAADGGAVRARALVVAVGVTPFPYVPPVFRGLESPVVLPAVRRTSYDDLAGRRVAVVGGGQTALEAAAAAVAAGAETELLVRGDLHWFADREPHAPRGALGRALYRLAYPAVGYGPPPLNRLVLHPDAFARLPGGVRRRICARLLRPGGSAWLRPRVEGGARITERVEVVGAELRDGCVLTLGDGTRRVVDAVVLATGYRFDLAGLGFLERGLRERIEVADGWPVLDRSFRSTHPGVFLVGYAAEGRFGPSARFVLGAPFAARRLEEALAR